jgi:hypothetical protein
MNDRRRALIALLDQYPLERDLFLHEGRRDVSPRDEFAEKIEALYAPSSEESHIDYVMGGSRPLLERYHDALEVVRKQAIIIQELEARPSLFQQVMGASETYVKRFGGELTEEGAIKKMHEEWGEVLQEIKMLQADAFLTSEPYAAQDTTMKELLAREVIDFFVTIGGVLSALNVPIEITVKAANATLDKLDERKEADYVWDPKSKTVIKRSKLEAGS